MFTKRSFVVFLFALSSSCTPATISVTSTFEFLEGSFNDLAGARSMWIRAVDEETGTDLSATLLKSFLSQRPDYAESCGSGDQIIDIEFKTSYTMCTHCPPGAHGPRYAYATFRRTKGQRLVANGLWTSGHGGTVESLIELFARDLGAHLPR